MANQPFDTTIINPLERPKSSDINAAQSELHRDILEYLYRAYETSSGSGGLGVYFRSGFVGAGFSVQPTSPESGSVVIKAGLGFLAGTPESNVNGIVGLNDLSPYKPVLMSQDKTISIPNNFASAGKCRRDAIYVRATRQLTDATPSDVYSVSSGVFTSQTINKTMSFDLYNQTMQVIAAGSGTTWTSGIVYAKGIEVSYTNADSWLNATITSAPGFFGYVRLAVINIEPIDILPFSKTFSAYSIADWRELLFANGVLDVVGSATLGGADAFTSTPAQFSNVKIRTPSGARACITRDTALYQNKYTLTVFGAPTADDVAAFFSLHGILSTFSGGDFGTPYGRPPIAAVISRTLAHKITEADQTVLSNDTLTSPPVAASVGQLVQRIEFSVGNAEYYAGVVTDIIYNTATSNFTSSGFGQTVDTSFNIKVAV
jgi:hypothetical protein